MKNNIISFETFKDIDDYHQRNLTQENPSCSNGMVRIRKYKVTIELIEESNEVLGERLQKMWDECDNRHNWEPLQNTAKIIGYELKGRAGNTHKK